MTVKMIFLLISWLERGRKLAYILCPKRNNLAASPKVARHITKSIDNQSSCAVRVYVASLLLRLTAGHQKY